MKNSQVRNLLTRWTALDSPILVGVEPLYSLGLKSREGKEDEFSRKELNLVILENFTKHSPLVYDQSRRSFMAHRTLIFYLPLRPFSRCFLATPRSQSVRG